MTTAPLPARFWHKIIITDTCFVFESVSKFSGYASFFPEGNSGPRRYAHRLAWEALRGPIPDGYEIDHICHNRACVRVDHMRLVTHAQNQENRSSGYGKSGIRGVRRRGNRYEAYARRNGRQYYAGMHDTLEEADQAARALRDRLFTHHLDGLGAAS